MAFIQVQYIGSRGEQCCGWGLECRAVGGGRLIQPYSYKPVDWGIQCWVCMLCHGRAYGKLHKVGVSINGLLFLVAVLGRRIRSPRMLADNPHGIASSLWGSVSILSHSRTRWYIDQFKSHRTLTYCPTSRAIPSAI